MNDLLVITLETAVPLRIHEVRDWTAEQRIDAARAAAPVLASHGDDLQFGGKHTQEAFRALVTGLACCAYQPGGVRFAGCRWVACASPAEYVMEDGRVLCSACAADKPVRPEQVDGDGSVRCQGAA